MGSKKTNADDFESSLQQLESILESLEAGNLTLEESLKSFEKGVLLTRQCQKTLCEAEQKVKILSEKELIESEVSDS